MTKEAESKTPLAWKSTEVYLMAGICLLLGVILGYLFRGSQSGPAQASQGAQIASAPAAASEVQSMPGLEQMKRMADKQVEPLLAKLKNDPDDANLLNQVGTIYKATHQFEKAIDYYRKSLQSDPKNVAARTDLASCLYYEGDLDGALSQLQQSLAYDPKNANALFNLGMIRWKGKGDAKAAVAAWDQLLKSNPSLPKDKRNEVESLIAETRQQFGR
jgi:cytochrome c-type biogenesis protein CcmH/NrfG